MEATPRTVSYTHLGYKLYTTGDTPYRSLFNSLDACSDEVILARRYSSDANVMHGVPFADVYKRQVSYIGCKDQDIKVNGREVINVNLADDNKAVSYTHLTLYTNWSLGFML